MIIELMVAILLGVTAGTLTGLIPGVHVNLVSVLIVAFAPVLLMYVSPIIIAVLIVSLALTHTFIDSIPSIFLGAPNPETVLSVLPGHKKLLFLQRR